MKRRMHHRLWLCAVLLSGAGCEPVAGPEESPMPENAKVGLVVIAGYAGPQLTVRSNGQNAGQINTRFTGVLNCGALFSAPPSQAVYISGFVGQTYTIEALYPGGNSWVWRNVTITEQMWRDSTCRVFEVPAP
jgi:hypothetical protein